MNKKIIFMGTPEIASFYLESLINYNYNIIATFSQPPRKKGRGMKIEESAVQKFAQSNKIKSFTPKNLEDFDTKKLIESLCPDLIVVMGYGIKIPSTILKIPKYGCINVHVSLLPRWRGAAPIEHAILNGDTKTGVTVFKLIEKMDAGPTIKSKSIIIESHYNKLELTKQLNIIGTRLLNSVIPLIFENKIIFQIQDDTKVTYANKISTEIRKLDFNNNLEIIKNKIRAFSPQPSAWFFFKSERIKIIESDFINGDWETAQILNKQFHIGCLDGKVCPKIIQREGKKPMNIKDFLRGFEFEVGTLINE